MSELLTAESLIAFFTLTGLEVVLGIDNIVFIAILAGKLPVEQREKARKMGLVLAVVSRIILLLSISWVMRLTQPLFEVMGRSVSGKDLILILGGAFLLAKATYEIHHKIDHATDDKKSTAATVTLRAVLIQVIALDVVFSLDSVITAVGLTPHIPIMIAAVLTSVAVMLALSGAIVSFIEKHPALKILALAFLILIGALLVAEGFHQKIGKGYIYFAMAFSVTVEILQIWATKKKPESPPVNPTSP
ncbi:MAG: TerC family protein [Polyangiaceae bacterium]|nr:TerC family protein [Polyangiaceae bacterium]